MKLNIKYIIGVAAVATLGMVSCTDEIKFGNAFLEKAPRLFIAENSLRQCLGNLRFTYACRS